MMIFQNWKNRKSRSLTPKNFFESLVTPWNSCRFEEISSRAIPDIFWNRPIPILSFKKIARKSATKVKNRWGSWKSLIFYQEPIDFGAKRVKFWKNLFNIFVLWGQPCGRCRYFGCVFGSLRCFSIELSEPNIIFWNFHLFFRYFWKICSLRQNLLLTLEK